ncbi:preprotein translocase subunit SecD [Georgenia satyanarayanai]|uniref:Protein translocase subunit SecD n=1 Tax=Georgenia satyanarayanai TaxID=860221 RepID=A0A2Y8ZZ71_9MICO|nr:protein translocase subunit SecD [Georgenia satyanarayanai]PYG02085.1 preprotein translocase subunit SecD [Georgenia satyanarayanai]SSA36896.1 preprotein translocase subunit SecD [Georgenia satyanarayanai]
MATTAPRPLRRIIVLLVIVAAMFGSVAIAQQLGDDDAEGGASFAPGLALDLEGGVQLILTPRLDPEAEGGDGEITEDDIDQAIEIIRQRVDASGVAEAEITRQGADNIVVGLPGRPDEATLDLVRQSAELRFRPVLTMTDPTPIDPGQEGLPTGPEDDAEAGAPQDGEEAAEESATDEATAPAEGEATEDAATGGEEPAGSEQPADADRAAIEEAAFAVADENGDGELQSTPATEPTSNSDPAWITEQLVYELYTLDCTDPANLVGGVQDAPDEPLVSCAQDGTTKFVLGPVDVEGTQVESAGSGLEVTQAGVTTNNWVVDIAFNDEGTELFREVSERLIAQPSPQNQFGIVLDGLVVSAPRMNQAILDGQAQISGSFTRESANTLANQLNFGSLPLNFEVQSEDQISATLGSEHLRSGLVAGLGGLLLVALYLLWQYRGLAVVAVSSLLIAAVTTYGAIIVLSWLQGYRLSLAGVAGLIVAVGITADSFILYFERIRDEIRDGRTLEGAVEHGWARARRTIIVSDLVTLLAAVILYFLAVGGVRGFAFTLGLTTLIDLVVVYLFTHPTMQLLIRTRFFGEGHRLSGLNPESIGVDPARYRGRGRVGEARTRPPAASRKEPAREKQPVGAGRTTIAERRAAERRAAEQATTTEEEGR